ncbi:MAG: hypothetical protein IID41_15585, partial [Planctomycetes bacterium]|nr:hypothetical protein [Planctomycetota bacterium]
MHMRSLATERLIMTVVCFATAAAPAAAQIDVEVRLIPVESPSGSDVVPDVGSLPSNTLILNRSVTPEFFLEVWVSDVGSVNTGVIAAYFDVTWDNGNLTDAIGTACSSLFSLLCEGSIENGINQVTNFGGSDGSFQGQGVEPLFARVGLIHFSALDDGELTFDAVVGLGEVGVLNRSVGDVAIIGANVIIGSCLTNEDCIDADLCNGQETCDVDSGQCAAGTPLDCPDDGN